MRLTFRNSVLLISFVLSLILYIGVLLTIPQGILQTIKLQQYFALIALTYLYFALLLQALYENFPKLGYKKQLLIAKPMFIVGAFYFGLLHAYISFFQQLGGFSGLFFLGNSYLIAISFSTVALLILFFLTLASFDFITKKIKVLRWKCIYGFLYAAGLLVLFHALLLGTHFQNLSDWIPQIIFFAVAFLLLLEAKRLDRYISPKFGIATVVTLSILLLFLIQSFVPQNTLQPFNIHAQHMQLAKDAQQGQTQTNLPQIPGLRGDRTKRFTVSFDHPENVIANQETTLSFRINDASSGNPVSFFEKVYEKPMHLIIVNQALSYFSHIHPDQTADGFTITTQFPKDDLYHLYIDFQPFGAIEQQFAFTIPVGSNDKKPFGIAQGKQVTSNKKTKKTFGVYRVALKAPQPLEASKLSIGEQELSFTIIDAKTKKSIKTLKPYLASFGHLVMINEKTYDYLHVHPTNLTAPKPNENGGPTVTFLPLGLYGPIKPGVYRIFAQFNPDNKLFTSDFTVKVN